MSSSKISVQESIAFAASAKLDSEVVLKGDLSWVYHDASGVPDESTRQFRKNLVVQTGKEYFAARAIDGTVPVMSHLAVGSNSATPVLGQTTLVNQLARVPFTSMTRAGNLITITATVPAGVGTGTIEELGLFNAAANGIMVSRALAGGIPKPAALAITWTWNLTVA